MNKKGRLVLSLGPAKGNPRNSEGAFLDLNDGRIMFAYSHYVGTSFSDDATACIAVCYSSDEGDTWTKPKIIEKPETYGAINIMSVSLLRLGDGDVGLFYLLRFGWHDTRLHLFRSSDEGNTWSEPVCCVSEPGYYVTNNDRVIRLTSGRLVAPMALHRRQTNRTVDHYSLDRRGMVYCYLSDDDGKTWRESRNNCTLSVANSSSGLEEPGIVELKNNALWMYCRTDLGRQYESFSIDEGETWSTAVPSAFTSPKSPLSVKRNPYTDDLLAIWNPIPNYQTRAFEKHTMGRTPLIGAISKDEGKTWDDHFLVAGEEDGGGYCYTAIHFTKKSVLLAYCAGKAEDEISLARLNITRIQQDDLIIK